MIRRPYTIALLSLLLVAALSGCVKKPDLSGKRVLMVVSEKNFRDSELKIPRDYLEKAGATVEVATSSGSEAIGVDGLRVTPDVSLQGLNVSRYSAIVFVGGPGTKKYLWPNKEAQRVVRDAVQAKKILGAICLAPGLLARADVLKGVRVTGFPDSDLKKEVQSAGGIYTGSRVERDGLIITANGPSAADAFARALADALAGSG